MQRHLTTITWLLLTLIGGAWLNTTSVVAQTYKWKDANGKIHYSDQPPPANAKEETTVKPRKPAAAPTAAPAPAGKGAGATKTKTKTYVEQEADFKKRQVEAAKREDEEKKKVADAAEKKQNCDRARAQLSSLQAGGRVTQTNVKGEREYMSDAQIAQAMEAGKKSVDSWCK